MPSIHDELNLLSNNLNNLSLLDGGKILSDLAILNGAKLNVEDVLSPDRITAAGQRVHDLGARPPALAAISEPAPSEAFAQSVVCQSRPVTGVRAHFR